MKMFDKRPLSVNISYAASVLAVATVMIKVWSITAVFTNKGTIFTGAQIVWNTISLSIFFLLNIVGISIAIWVHHRHSLYKTKVWLTLLSSVMAYISIFSICGGITDYILDGMSKNMIIPFLGMMVFAVGSFFSFKSALRCVPKSSN